MEEPVWMVLQDTAVYVLCRIQARHVRLYLPLVALSLVIMAECAHHLQTMKATPANVLLAGKVNRVTLT